MDLINENVEHFVFGKGRIISQDNKLISIQFSKETGIKRFAYPEAFEKYLNMCSPAAAHKVLADLTAKREQIEEQQRKADEITQKALENLELTADKRKLAQKAKQTKASK